MLYKVTYDLVAIPASQYLTRNTRLSRHIHPLSYKQIPTLKDYNRFTFFSRSIIHWNALPAHIPVLPTLALFSSAVCQVIHVSPKHQFLFLPFHCTDTFTLYKLISPLFFTFISANTLQHLVHRNPSDAPLGV